MICSGIAAIDDSLEPSHWGISPTKFW